MADLKTKIFTGILSSTMVFTSLPALASHADTEKADNTIISIEKDDGDYDPNAPVDSGYCGTNYAYWSLDKYGTLFISGDKGAKMNNYKKIGEAPWYKYKDQITCIYVMGGITNIGNYAFANMYGFIRIDEATDLKTIGSYAFYNTQYDYVDRPFVFPSGVTSIGSYAFYNVNIIDVKLPASLVSIGSHAFEKTLCPSIVLPSKVSSIGSSAFANMPNLVSVTGGSSVKTIGSYAFRKNPKLVTFKITSSKLTTIGSYAFSGDSRLKTVYIQKTKKLTKKKVKKSLKGSSVKTVKVKKSKVKTYKKYFTKKNCGRKVKVKK